MVISRQFSVAEFSANLTKGQTDPDIWWSG